MIFEIIGIISFCASLLCIIVSMIADTTFSLEKLANMFATASMLFIAVLVIDACVGGVLRTHHSGGGLRCSVYQARDACAIALSDVGSSYVG